MVSGTVDVSASGGPHPAEVAPHSYREAMSAMPSAVSVVATRDPSGRPVGLLVQSIFSLSLDPPRLLISIASTSRTLPHILGHRSFSVNVLSVEGRDLCTRFASRYDDKFADVAWRSSGPEHDVPLLTDGVSANTVCTIEEVLPRHQHVLIIGQVVDVAVHQANPVLYHRRGFHRLGALDADART